MSTSETPMSETTAQNGIEFWVPAIPMPLFLFVRKQCSCGRRFWTSEGYRAHYALHHILRLP